MRAELPGLREPPHSADSLPPAPHDCEMDTSSLGCSLVLTQERLADGGLTETLVQTPAGPLPDSGAAPPGPRFLHVMRIDQ